MGAARRLVTGRRNPHNEHANHYTQMLLLRQRRTRPAMVQPGYRIWTLRQMRRVDCNTRDTRNHAQVLRRARHALLHGAAIMNAFRVTYTNGESYETCANGTAKDLLD